MAKATGPITIEEFIQNSKERFLALKPGDMLTQTVLVRGGGKQLLAMVSPCIKEARDRRTDFAEIGVQAFQHLPGPPDLVMSVQDVWISNNQEGTEPRLAPDRRDGLAFSIFEFPDVTKQPRHKVMTYEVVRAGGTADLVLRLDTSADDKVEIRDRNLDALLAAMLNEARKAGVTSV